MEWLCVHGKAHGAFVGADEEEFDSRFLRADQLERAGRAPTRYGYCSVCMAAMRWDIGRQELTDWPEGNLIPHCAYCRKPMVHGQHYLANITVDLATFFQPYLKLDGDHLPTLPPAIDNVDVCGPVCLIQHLLLNERIEDVFNR